MKIAVFFSGRVVSDKLVEHMTTIKNWPDHEFVFFSSQNAAVAKEESTESMKSILSMTDEQSSVEVTHIPDWMFSCFQPYLWSQFYHNKKCMDMVLAYQERHHVSFDIVLKYRPDVQRCTPIPFETPQENTLYIPSDGDWMSGVNDMFAYGDVPSMIQYCSLIDYLHEYHFIQGVLLHPETLLGVHIRSQPELRVSRFPYDFGGSLLSSRGQSWTW
jgi:hypothetical protein